MAFDDEYISRKEAILAVTRDGCTANVVGVLYHLPAADVVPKSDIIPCKIGDEVYAVKPYRNCKRIYKGKVTQMYFVGEEMKLAIVVNSIARGEWGKSVFATEEEAERALRECPDCKHFVGCECFDGKPCDSFERKESK